MTEPEWSDFLRHCPAHACPQSLHGTLVSYRNSSPAEKGVIARLTREQAEAAIQYLLLAGEYIYTATALELHATKDAS